MRCNAGAYRTCNGCAPPVDLPEAVGRGEEGDELAPGEEPQVCRELHAERDVAAAPNHPCYSRPNEGGKGCKVGEGIRAVRLNTHTHIHLEEVRVKKSPLEQAWYGESRQSRTSYARGANLSPARPGCATV
jgi:hypothetical protein